MIMNVTDELLSVWQSGTEHWSHMKAGYLQAGDLLSKALLLFGQDALVQLGVGLHDAVLGCQHRHHFLKIKILTRERQPQSNTQARKQIYARTHTHTQWQGKPQNGRRTPARSNHKWHHRSQSQTGASSQRCANTTQARTHTINANATTTTRDAGRKEDNERENRTGHECLTFQQKLLHLHQRPIATCVCVCICVCVCVFETRMVHVWFHAFRENTDTDGSISLAKQSDIFILNN